MTRLPLRVALVALVLPVTAVVIGLALLLAWLPDLPETIAIHFAFDGTADGFGPAWSVPVLLGIVGLSLTAILGGIVARSITPAGPTTTQKLLAVTSLFAGVFLTFAMTSSVAVQRDGGDTGQLMGPILGVGLLAALALAALGWVVLPKAVPSGTSAAAAVPAVPLAPGERVAWVGNARFAAGIIAVLIGTVVLASGAVTFAIALGAPWALAIVPVVLAAALLGTTSWSVRVDARGLLVRGLLGWPRYRVETADVASAGVSAVVPLGEFGGYGIRWGLGRRLGIITRGGEALEVLRRDGRAVVVTVDDAATAAGLLTAYAANG